MPPAAHAASDPTPGPRHPAPERARVSRLALWTGIFGGPFWWTVQLLVGYGLVAHNCYPAAVPRPRPVFEGTRAAVVWVSALALAGTLGAGLVAVRSWRATRGEKDGGTQEATHLLHNAEGRTRFMAMGGLIMSGLFLFGVVAGAMPLVVGRVCAW